MDKEVAQGLNKESAKEWIEKSFNKQGETNIADKSNEVNQDNNARIDLPTTIEREAESSQQFGGNNN